MATGTSGRNPSNAPTNETHFPNLDFCYGEEPKILDLETINKRVNDLKSQVVETKRPDGSIKRSLPFPAALAPFTTAQGSKIRTLKNPNDQHIIEGVSDSKTYYRTLVSYFPPRTHLSLRRVLATLGEIPPGLTPSCSSPYTRVRKSLQRCIRAASGLRYRVGMEIHSMIPSEEELEALLIYGNSDGFGMLPPVIECLLKQAGLYFLVVEPKVRIIPDCWTLQMEKSFGWKKGEHYLKSAPVNGRPLGGGDPAMVFNLPQPRTLRHEPRADASPAHSEGLPQETEIKPVSTADRTRYSPGRFKHSPISIDHSDDSSSDSSDSIELDETDGSLQAKQRKLLKKIEVGLEDIKDLFSVESNGDEITISREKLLAIYQGVSYGLKSFKPLVHQVGQLGKGASPKATFQPLKVRVEKSDSVITKISLEKIVAEQEALRIRVVMLEEAQKKASLTSNTKTKDSYGTRWPTGTGARSGGQREQTEENTPDTTFLPLLPLKRKIGDSSA